MQSRARVLAALGIVTLLGVAAAEGQASYCLTNADTAVMYISNVQEIVVESDSTELASVGLPRVPIEQVVLVTNNNTCKKAVAAYRTATGQTTIPTAAYVIKVGTARLVVVHPNHGSGEFRSHIVLNASTFAYVAWIEG